MVVVVAFSHASMLRLDGSDPQGLKLKHAPLFLSTAVILYETTEMYRYSSYFIKI
jgi:hypothetical protein